MAEGIQPGTIAELNEALKNSFAAIKNDMNFLREQITSHENKFDEQIKLLQTTFLGRLDTRLQDNQTQMEQVHIRLDELSEKTSADVDFLNEALSAVPQGARADDSIQNAYIEQQFKEIQNQITLIKNNSKEVFLSEQYAQDVKELSTAIESLRMQIEASESKLQTVENENKNLKDTLSTIRIEQANAVSQDAIGKLHKTVETVLQHVSELDSKSQHLTQQTVEWNNLNEAVAQLQKQVQEQTEQLSLDVEHKLSNHAVVENKNFQTIKNQLIEFKQDLATLENSVSSVSKQTETFALNEDMQGMQQQLSALVKVAATKQEITTNKENIKRIADRISLSEEQIRKELDTYLEQERAARSEQVVTKGTIEHMIAQAQEVSHNAIEQAVNSQKEAHLILTEKLDEHLEARARVSDVETMHEKVGTQIQNLQNALEELQSHTNDQVDQRVDELMQTIVELQNNMNDISAHLQTTTTEVEHLQEHLLPKEDIALLQEKSDKRFETENKELQKRIEKIATNVQKLAEESATKEYVDVIDTAATETIQALKEDLDELKDFAKGTDKERKEFSKSSVKKIKELQKDLDYTSNQLVTHNKTFDKVAKQITDLRSDVSKNYDSSRKLNKLIKKFGQLKEITLSNEVLELDQRPKSSVAEGISDQIKSIKKMFKKKPKKSVPPTYQSWNKSSIQEMDKNISQSLEKLEKAPNLTDESVPELLSTVRKVEEKKEEIGKKKKVGIIAQIGLDQGIITEKDLK